MALPMLHVRSPFPPHEEVLKLRPIAPRYSRLLSRPGTATFSVAANNPALTTYGHYLTVGMMVTLQRTDRLFPWVGFIDTLDAQAGGKTIDFAAKDHVGALFGRGRTPFSWRERETTAAIHITQILGEADARGEPPLMVGLDLGTGGPAVKYTPQAESLLRFLTIMEGMTGWEWGLSYEVLKEVRTTLTWRERQGNRNEHHVFWEEGRHFQAARYRQSAEGYISAAVAVGGSGTFSERAAAAVSASGVGYDFITTRKLSVPVDEPAALPSLSGTRVRVQRQVTNEAALLTAATRMHQAPEHVREAISFTLAEDELDLSYPPGVGDVVSVRFSDILAGQAITRQVRILGLTMIPAEGLIRVETQVLREGQHDAT